MEQDLQEEDNDPMEEEEKDPIEECKDFVVDQVAEVLKSIKGLECLFGKLQERVTQVEKESTEDRVGLRKRIEKLEEQVNGLKTNLDNIQKDTTAKADQKQLVEIERQMTVLNYEVQSAKIKSHQTDTQVETLEKDFNELTQTGLVKQINDSINDHLTKFINGGLAGIGRTFGSDDSAYVDTDLISVSEADVSNFFEVVASSTPKVVIEKLQPTDEKIEVSETVEVASSEPVEEKCPDVNNNSSVEDG